MKKGVLSKLEKFYIEGHIDQTPEDIATELDRSVNIVSKYIAKVKPKLKKQKKEKEKEKEKERAKPKKKETHMMQVMGRHKRNGQNVATIMTPAASELGDIVRKQTKLNKKMQSAIHKPRG